MNNIPSKKPATVSAFPVVPGSCGDPQNTRLYQIFYRPCQAEQLDVNFIPYCNVENPRPEWCEYFVFRKEYYAGTCGVGITGFLSWKFRQKTGVSGEAFRNWINEHPGYDVYFVNPFPHLAQKRRPNVWYQGDRRHPGMSKIAQELLAKIGFKMILRALRMEERHIAYCNYWAGTPEFWRRYMNFCEPLYELIENGLSRQAKATLLMRADKVSDCCYIPYIFERLFSTLLCVDGSIRSLGMHTVSVPRLSWGGWMRRELYRPYKRYMAKRGAPAKHSPHKVA